MVSILRDIWHIANTVEMDDCVHHVYGHTCAYDLIRARITSQRVMWVGSSPGGCGILSFPRRFLSEIRVELRNFVFSSQDVISGSPNRGRVLLLVL